jgi:hypothetical protein
VSNQYAQITFVKTFMPDYSDRDYVESGITTLEHVAAYEKYMHAEQLVPVEDILRYEDNDYESLFQVVEIGEVLPDGTFEVLQPDVGGLVVVTTEYKKDAQKYSRIYRRTVNKNHIESDPWYDYYQDVSESYVAGITWQTILSWIKNKEQDKTRTVEIMEPRPHHAKIVYTAPDRTIDLFDKAQEDHFSGQHAAP